MGYVYFVFFYIIDVQDFVKYITSFQQRFLQIVVDIKLHNYYLHAFLPFWYLCVRVCLHKATYSNYWLISLLSVCLFWRHVLLFYSVIHVLALSYKWHSGCNNLFITFHCECCRVNTYWRVMSDGITGFRYLSFIKVIIKLCYTG